MEDFLGFNIYKSDSDTYHLSQPKLINQILYNVGLSKFDTSPRTTPSLTIKILVKYLYAENLINTFTITVS